MAINLDSIMSAISDLMDGNNLATITTDPTLNTLILKGGLTDVVNNLSWSVSNSKQSKSQTPYIELDEFQQTEAALKQAMEFYATQAKQYIKSGTTDGYESLYIAKPTGNSYKIPFFSSYNHTTSNAWAENKGDLQKAVDEYLIKNLQRFVLPGAGIEVAKQWQGSADSSFAFTFQLLNTVNPKKDIYNNYLFITTLLYNNLLDRQNAVAIAPPVIYRYNIPGVRMCPAAVMSTVRVENIGQINHISGKNIPDAWEITIEMLDLVKESRQVYAGVNGGRVVTAIINPSESTASIIPSQFLPPSEVNISQF